MCKEDLKLGKGRFAGPTVTASGSTAQLLLPDPRRVALIVSMACQLTFDSAGAIVIQDAISLRAGDSVASPIIAASFGTSIVFILRIEDVGNLITGAFSCGIGTTLGTALLSLTPILTNLEITPIASGAI